MKDTDGSHMADATTQVAVRSRDPGEMKPRILVCSDWYRPGNKGGGSVSAISNLIELLGEEWSFYLITRNYDHGDHRPYENIAPDQWLRFGKAHILYTTTPSFQNIHRRVCEIKPHILYLNSFFSTFSVKSLILRKFGLIGPITVILAPRGELSPAALEIKARRKSLYQRIAVRTGLYEGILWQASSSREEQQIRAALMTMSDQSSTRVAMVPDVPDAKLFTGTFGPKSLSKESGMVRLVSLSRISPQKNLLFTLEILKFVRGTVLLDIYGPIDDPSYWQSCVAATKKLPKNIGVEYKSAVPSLQVRNIFSKYHFQLLPTRGENFGYVILEALACGCPVITSDETPWRNLAQSGVGWDLQLADRKRWIDVLQECVEMDQSTFESMSRRSRDYFEQWVSNAGYRESSIALFQTAMQQLSLSTPRTLEKSLGARS